MDIEQIIAPRFLPQIVPTAPYVEDRNPPTATEPQGMEFVIVSAMRNDPVAQLGYAPGVYQHNMPTHELGSYGTYLPARQEVRINPRMYGRPEFAGIGRHEFRHRGLRELMDWQQREQPDNYQQAEQLGEIILNPTLNEDITRVLDVVTNNQVPRGTIVDPTSAGRRQAENMNSIAETLLNALTQRYVLGANRRWGDW